MGSDRRMMADEKHRDPMLSAVAARLGEDRFSKRLMMQSDQRAKLQHQGEGILKIERFIPVNAIVLKILKWTGMFHRAYRNFLDIRVVEQSWTLKKLPRSFDGFRLLQLTDLHLDLDLALGPVLEDLLASTPHDAVVVTGDFRNLTSSDFGAAMRATEKIISLLAPDRWGTLGNHDFIEKVPELERAGLPILLNECATIRRGDDQLWICGIDDPHFYGTHDIEKVAAASSRDACRILLSHSPEVAEIAAGFDFDLMLSGHTHGGQICLPGGRAVVVPVWGLSRDLICGRWQRGQMQGYTSPGTGSCGVPARFNCPPEITVHVLNAG